MILKQNALRQLQQRITFSYQLRPLDFAGTVAYVEHRLQCAGFDRATNSGVGVFEHKAMQTLFAASGGTPRIINVLAHKALMCAFGKRSATVSKEFVLAAIDDTESVSRPSRMAFLPFRRAAALAAAALPVMGLVNHFIPELNL